MRVWWDYESFLVQPYQLAPPPVVLLFAMDDQKPELIHARDSAMQRILLWCLEDPNVTMVAHSGAFEACVTMAARPDWCDLIWDKMESGKMLCTLMREKCIRIGLGDNMERKFNLDACCEGWDLNIKLDKEDYWRKRYGMLFSVPISLWTDEQKNYVLGDVAVRDLYWAQERGVSEDYLVDQVNQACADFILRLTSCWGYPTDTELARKLYTETELKLDAERELLLQKRLVSRICEKGEVRIKSNDKFAKTLIEAAYARQGREPPRGKPTEKMKEKDPDALGNIKLDEEACDLSMDPVLQALSRFKKAGTLLGKIKRISYPRIQTHYDALKATGRTSSTQGEEPDPGEAYSQWGTNVQNLPRVGDEVEAENS